METPRERQSDQIPLGRVGPSGTATRGLKTSTYGQGALPITEQSEFYSGAVAVPLTPPAQRVGEQLSFRPKLTRAPRILSVVNRKGGVGKTTTAFNLAGTLAQKGNQVLLIDMDPMGSLCRSLRIRPGEKALSDLLVGLEGSLGELIRSTHIKNLYVIPGDPNLRTFEMRYGASVGYRHALRDKLNEVLKWKPFPFIVIDCPPSLGLISGNALIAANEVIIPVDGSTYGMGALVDTMRVINLVRTNANPSLSVCGLLLNNVDLSTMYDRTVLDVLRGQFQNLLFKSVVPTSPESDISSQMGEPVIHHSPTSWMAKAYHQFADEVLVRGRKHVA